MTSELLHLPHPLGYTSGPHSPELPFGRTSLDIRLVPATTPGGPTLALCGACNLERDVVRSYGSRVSAAIRIVARHAQTGSLYSATALHHDAVALSLDRLPLPASDPTRGDEPRTFEGMWFTLDLAQHLVLPPDGADYQVFAWLDGLLSSLEQGTVPSAAGRVVRGSLTRWLVEPSFRPAHGTATEAAPRLELDGTRGLVLHVPAPLHALEPSLPLSVLIQATRSRELRELAIEASAWHEAAANGAIALDLELLDVHPDPGDLLHVIALVGETRSAVLPIAAMGLRH